MRNLLDQLINDGNSYLEILHNLGAYKEFTIDEMSEISFHRQDLSERAEFRPADEIEDCAKQVVIGYLCY